MKTLSFENLPPIKISGLPAIIIFLLKEEIKNYTFVKRLEDTGFDTSYISANLGFAILSLMDFGEHTDELMGWYWKKLEHYTEGADITDRTLLSNLAFSFYIDLEIERRLRFNEK
jgi:hypothetical protein